MIVADGMVSLSADHVHFTTVAFVIGSPMSKVGMRTKDHAAFFLRIKRAWYRMSFAVTQRCTRGHRRTHAGSGANPPPKLDC